MRLLYFIISHSLFIATCAAALCFQTAILLKITLSAWFYFFIFCSTICSYNFYWLLSGWAFSKATPAAYLQKHISNLIVFFIAAAGIIVSLVYVSYILPVAAIAALLTLLYAVPLLPVKWLQFTRWVGLLKTGLLAFTWAFITVYIPYAFSQAENNFALLLLFCIRFIFMLLLCIMFDARDTAMDKIKGLQSLTTLLKPAAVKQLMLILFAMYLIAGITYRVCFNEPGQITALLITGAAVAAAYVFSLKKQGYFFYYFIIDGLMLFSAAATFIASI